MQARIITKIIAACGIHRRAWSCALPVAYEFEIMHVMLQADV